MVDRFVCYFRVSTDKQGIKGLGIEAQREAIRNYLALNGGEVVGSFEEVETGKKNDRPELLQAIEKCRRTKATLLIAKLDRLGRNLHFISGLMESGIEFKAVDNPHANKFMVHMLAAFAEHERELIAERTKNALRAAKERGVKL
ncbi:MAG TPA: recombinase family protein [Micavibrio sp.]|nr:recombinase family protein [Micavibrio sp.]